MSGSSPKKWYHIWYQALVPDHNPNLVYFLKRLLYHIWYQAWYHIFGSSPKRWYHIWYQAVVPDLVPAPKRLYHLWYQIFLAPPQVGTCCNGRSFSDIKNYRRQAPIQPQKVVPHLVPGLVPHLWDVVPPFGAGTRNVVIGLVPDLGWRQGWRQVGAGAVLDLVPGW